MKHSESVAELRRGSTKADLHEHATDEDCDRERLYGLCWQPAHERMWVCPSSCGALASDATFLSAVVQNA